MDKLTVPQPVLDFLKLREGVKHVVYHDTKQLPTGGVGHLLTEAEKAAHPVGSTITDDAVNNWLANDSLAAYTAAFKQAVTLKSSSQDFIRVLTSVNFQLGTGWNTLYKKTWAHMLAGEWEAAAVEAQNSGWFKQTPVRVKDFQDALRGMIKKA